MDSRLHRSLARFLVAAALTGCDDEIEPGLADPAPDGDEEVSARYLPMCPKCQFNAATVNGFPISALDLTGAPNSADVAISHLRDPGGLTYRFGLVGEEMAAFVGEKPIAVADELSGWELVFMVKGLPRTLTIGGHKLLPSYASNGPPVGVYTLEGSFDDGPPRNVCPTQSGSTTALTVIHGETYDGEHKRVDEVGEQWITLACVDEAAYKVKRLGYGPHGNQGPGGQPATLAQRNSTLKMVTADFCGDGHSFTGYHKSFYVRNRSGTVTTSAPGAIVDMESYWDEHGALCLTNPRFGQLAEVEAMCDLPSCAEYAKIKPLPPYEWRTFVHLYTTPQ